MDNGSAVLPFAPEASFTINPPPPVAADQYFTLLEDTTLAFTLAAVEPDGDPLSYEIMRPPHHGSLTGVAPNLMYQPVTNFFGTDDAQFEVSDPFGAFATFVVTFTITPVVDVPNPTLTVRFLADGTPFVSLRAEPYGTYVVETSTNLVVWKSLWTYSSSDGNIEFIGQPAPRGQSRFYRVRTP